MKPLRPLPKGPLVTFYGDDFTGSSASMELLAFSGLETVLFLSSPTPERLRDFAAYRGIGIAGIARSRDPDWMDQNLPPIFSRLKSLHAPVVHYKVCSTFDSSPWIGSIGCAIDLASKQFDGWIPMVVADPGMGRFQSFGHLFALAQDKGYRLDRHPTMSKHPTTPMDESDLGRHLAKQTDKMIGLVDFVAMKQGRADKALAQALGEGAVILSLDVVDEETLIEAGRLIWERDTTQIFTVGSQGIEAALIAYWRHVGLLPQQAAATRVEKVDRIICVSGSVSPVTASQIAFATENGFTPIRIDAARSVDESQWAKEVEQASESALHALSAGNSPLVFTAAGPDDSAVVKMRQAVARSGVSATTLNDRIGAGLGQLLDKVIRKTKLPRVVISGGDTSSHAATMLGIDALTAISPLAPGSPLCRAHSTDPARNGLEITLKGGQVGGPNFFCLARDGTT
jgi:3-oxoisoapionate kinase